MHMRKRGLRFDSFIAPKANVDHFMVNIKSWDHFYDMMKRVERSIVTEDIQLQNPKFLNDIPVEKVTDIWTDTIWEEIFKSFYTLFRDGKLSGRAMPRSVLKYFDETYMGAGVGNAQQEADRLFDECKSEVKEYLRSHGRQCFVLFDTMEKYPVQNPVFRQLLGGLIRAISKFKDESQDIYVVFSLPEELVEIFKRQSTNLLKDFDSSYPIRWKPIDLLRIVAHRYRLFLEVHEDSSIDAFSKLDLSDRHDIRKFYDIWLPAKITNQFGNDESPLAYIARHTHLLPRHMLALFDQVAIETENQTGGYRQLSSEGILKGVANKEEWIAEEVLAPYEFIYKDIKKNLKGALQNVAPIFEYGELQTYAPKVRRTYGWDQDELMEQLYQMGVIGRIVREETRYLFADYYFNRVGAMGFPHDAKYCVHPIFSKLFGCVLNRAGDDRIIYPESVDFEMMDE